MTTYQGFVLTISALAISVHVSPPEWCVAALAIALMIDVINPLF